MNDLAPAPPQKSGPNSISILVSLFFVLLSFFIMMSNLSVRDNVKLESLVNSINLAFDLPGKLLVQKKQPHEKPTGYILFLRAANGWVDMLDSSLGKTTATKKGEVILIRVEEPNLFTEDGTALTQAGHNVLKRLVEIALEASPDTLQEVDILLALPKDLKGPAAPFKAAIVNAALHDAGVPGSLYSIGLADSVVKSIAFTFAMRVPPHFIQYPSIQVDDVLAP